ncbi:MAG: hypothetical protein ACK5MI_02135 [Mangrovibacterium sp.]
MKQLPSLLFLVEDEHNLSVICKIKMSNVTVGKLAGAPSAAGMDF